MNWQPAAQPPKPFRRVWVKTDSGAQTTGYVTEAGKWRINCARIAALKPAVISWRE